MAETALLELQQLRDIVTEARRPGLGVSIKSRRYQFRTYQNCFIAKEFVSWIVEHGHAQGREAAVTLGRRMSSVGLLNHVLYEKPFNDAMLYFRFQDDEKIMRKRQRRLLTTQKRMSRGTMETKASYAKRRETVLGHLAQSTSNTRRRRTTQAPMMDEDQLEPAPPGSRMKGALEIARPVETCPVHGIVDDLLSLTCTRDAREAQSESSESGDDGETCFKLDTDEAASDCGNSPTLTFESLEASAYDVPSEILCGSEDSCVAEAGRLDEDESATTDAPHKPKDPRAPVRKLTDPVGTWVRSSSADNGKVRPVSLLDRLRTESQADIESEYEQFLLGTLPYDDDELALTWNERFQAILRDLSRGGDDVGPYKRLVSLSNCFLHTALSYGKIIISEISLEEEKRTIKPVQVGGVAGGLKYIVQGILFKFALDTHGIYGTDDEAAATVAGHELKGLNAYLQCFIPGLHLPLMCLVDYLGFRLIAMAYLPIDKSTLVYGTSDGGNTIHCCDTVMRAMMKQACAAMHLQPHYAGLDPSRRRWLFSAADIEGHVGHDGRRYLLDFSRALPCETPRKVGDNLTRLFRPEFVRMYPQRLSPDAYSGFADSLHNPTNDAATQDLHLHLTVRVSNLLERHIKAIETREVDNAGEKSRKRSGAKLSPRKSRNSGHDRDAFDREGHSTTASASIYSLRLTEMVHREGVNVRHLGRVYSSALCTTSPYRSLLCAVIMREMLARAIKRLLRKKFRQRLIQLGKPVADPYITLGVAFINLVFGNGGISRRFWRFEVLPKLRELFEELDLRGNCDVSFAVPPQEEDMFKEKMALLLSTPRDPLPWQWILLERLMQMQGMTLSPSAQRRLSSGHRGWATESPLHNGELLSPGEGIKHMNIVSFAKGYILYREGIEAHHRDPAQASEKLLVAIAHFEDVLNSNSTDAKTLRECAGALLLLERIQKSAVRPTGSPYGQRAARYLQRAIEVSPRDSIARCLYAQYLNETGDAKQAEEYYLQALEIFPFDANALLLYSNFLHSQGEVAVSQRFSEYEAHFRTHPLGGDEETDADDASDDDEGDTEGGDGGDVKR